MAGQEAILRARPPFRLLYEDPFPVGTYVRGVRLEEWHGKPQIHLYGRTGLIDRHSGRWQASPPGSLVHIKVMGFRRNQRGRQLLFYREVPEAELAAVPPGEVYPAIQRGALLHRVIIGRTPQRREPYSYLGSYPLIVIAGQSVKPGDIAELEVVGDFRTHALTRARVPTERF